MVLLLLKEGKYLKLLILHWLRKITLNYIHISTILDTAFGTVLIPERWMFLLLRTEHTFFKVFLPNPILYSYLVWLLIMPGLIWKHLFLIVKMNCAPSAPAAAFEVLCGSGVARHLHPFDQSFVPPEPNVVPSALAAKWFQRMSDKIFEYLTPFSLLICQAGPPPVPENLKWTGLYTLMERNGELTRTTVVLSINFWYLKAQQDNYRSK